MTAFGGAGLVFVELPVPTKVTYRRVVQLYCLLVCSTSQGQPGQAAKLGVCAWQLLCALEFSCDFLQLQVHDVSVSRLEGILAKAPPRWRRSACGVRAVLIPDKPLDGIGAQILARVLAFETPKAGIGAVWSKSLSETEKIPSNMS